MGHDGGHGPRPDLRDLELTSERLLLRRWRPEDAGRVHAVMQDDAMFTWLALPRPYTHDDATAFVTRFGHEGRDEGTGLGCAVVERDGGRLVGAAALRLGATWPDIGYWVAPDAQGHGYAAEASATLAAFAVDTLGAPRVGLACDVRNLASARTALAAGFRFEGVVREGAPNGTLGPGPGDLAVFGRAAGDPPGRVPPTFPSLPPGGAGDGTLTLRPLDAGDTDPFAEADGDPLSRANGFGGPERTRREVERFCAQAPLQWLVGTAVTLAIVDARSGAYAGSLALRRSGPPGVGVVGYVVHPDARGHGVAARALRLLAPWAFAHGFARLELGAKVDNVASQRAALAGGFLPDGVMRGRLRAPDGTYHDEARFALLPSDLA